jgi:tRNA modification GTPase
LREEDQNLIDKNTIIILNKIDLCEKMPDWVNNLNPIAISLTNRINTSNLFQRLEEKIINILPNNFSGQSSALITQERYRISLKNAVGFLEEFSLDKNIELAAEDLRMTAREIGKITGKVDIENILDVIFSSFCIGK